MPARKLIDEYWLSERMAIKTEHIPRPTPRQLHDALNETIKDLRGAYGELDIPQWPATSVASPAPDPAPPRRA